MEQGTHPDGGWSYPRRTQTTGSDGQTRLDDFPWNRQVALDVRHERFDRWSGSVEAWKADDSASPDERRTELRVVLERPPPKAIGTFIGHVLDPRGRPIPDATVG